MAQPESPQIPDHSIIEPKSSERINLFDGETAEIRFNGHSVFVTCNGHNLMCINEHGQSYELKPHYALQISRGSNNWYSEDQSRQYPRIDNSHGVMVVDNVSDNLQIKVTRDVQSPQQQQEKLEIPSARNAMNVIDYTDNIRFFEDFKSVECALGGRNKNSESPVRNIVFSRLGDDIEIFNENINDSITLEPGKSVKIGREYQPGWFEGKECNTISRKHLTVTNQNGNLLIQVHNTNRVATILERLV